MITVTFTELRNHAKKYFDAVELGESVEIFRKGRPVARLTPYDAPPERSRWKKGNPLAIPGVSLTRMILEDRRASP